MCVCTPSRRTPWCADCRPGPPVSGATSQTEASLREELAQLRAENARLRAEPPKAPGTLTVERHGENVYLMLNHLDRSEPLALFVSTAAPGKFIDALARAKASAHAMGRSGI